MSTIKDNIITELKKIYDPEIPINIWDLGLIYDIKIKPKEVVIDMTFTSPTCPMMDEILEQVKNNVQMIVKNKTLKINLVWEPVWDISRMSQEAKIELDLVEQGW